MKNIIKKNYTKPEVHCVNLDPSVWANQCREINEKIKSTNSTTFIVGLKQIIIDDPISAKRALQLITSAIQRDNNSYKLAALQKDLILLTPFKLISGE